MRVLIRQVNAEHVWPLRHKILRAGQPFSTAKYPHDNHAKAAHFAALLLQKDETTTVGVVSLYPEKVITQADTKLETATEQKIGWRLRGMAVNSTIQGHNIGSALINTCYNHVINQGGIIGLWCNARLKATSYYLKNGFQVVGQPFDIPDIPGSHCVMINTEPKPQPIVIKKGMVITEQYDRAMSLAA